jgi:hypothetical protein
MVKYIVLFLVFCTFLTTIFFYKKITTIPLKYFIFFIWYGLFSEIVANILSFYKVSTVLINNIYWVCSTLFYLIFYSLIYTNHKFKKVSYFFIGIYLVALIFNNYYLQNYISDWQTNTYIFSAFLIIIVIILFFIEVLNSDKILVLNKLLIFWISIGLLIFNLALIPVLVVAEFIRWSGIFKYILLGVNIIMYSCFITGFIVSKKEYNN